MAWKMAGLAGSQFSAAQRGPGYAEYSAWASSVQGNPFYSDRNQSDFIYYSMMGYDDPVNLDLVNDFLQNDDQQANFLGLHYSGRTIRGFADESYYDTQRNLVLRMVSNDGLFFHSASSFVYDGQVRYQPLIHRMQQAGSHVRVDVKNLNVLGVQLDLQDITFYTYKKSWFGIKRRIYLGDSYSFTLLPYQTKSFDFSRFAEAPMNWTFELNTRVSDAAIVRLTFYSNWVPGVIVDPYSTITKHL